MGFKEYIKGYKYYSLFSNCVLTKGYNKSIITDLQKNYYISVTNEHYNLLKDFERLTIDGVLKKYQNKKWVLEAMEYFHNIDIAYFFNEKRIFFPKLNTVFNTPYDIHDCIIELSAYNHKNKEKVLESLAILGVQTLEFVSFDILDYKQISEWFKLIPNTRIRNIELSYKFDGNDIVFFQKFLNDNPIIGKLILHTCHDIKSLDYKDEFQRLLFVSQPISKLHCGNIHPNYFASNLEHYVESANHNTCLNRKLAIDINGNIKNCPYLKDDYGNTSDVDLVSIVKTKRFKKYWNFKKDDITICKDCEFRHICTDCRAYLENPEDIYSKPLKCGYNPYTNVWEEWSTNPIKQKAIKYYGMEELVKK